MKATRITIALMTLISSFAVNAQKAPLETTESKLARGEPLLIGVRGTSSPFAYKHNGTYQGLAVDICLKVFESVKVKYPNATYKFVETNPQNRLTLLNDGKIDLECGSTANTPERSKEVDFSVPFYISYVKAIKLKTTKLEKIADVKKDTVIAITKGTSGESSIKNVSVSYRIKSKELGLKPMIANSHKESLDLVATGQATIFVGSDILLDGVLRERADKDRFIFLKEIYQVDPFAVAIRKNDKWINVETNKTIIKLMKTSEFRTMYDKWFMQPIAPKNQALNIPMYKMMADVYRFPTNITGN